MTLSCSLHQLSQARVRQHLSKMSSRGFCCVLQWCLGYPLCSRGQHSQQHHPEALGPQQGGEYLGTAVQYTSGAVAALVQTEGSAARAQGRGACADCNRVSILSPQAQVVRATMTLPKRMLPLSMSSAKRTLYKIMSGMRNQPVSANSSAAANANAFTPIDFARELERRERANAPPSGGTAVLERPRPAPETEEETKPEVKAPRDVQVPKRRASLKRNTQTGSGLRPLQ